MRGVLDREEKAILAGFLSLQKPKKAMREEAASAGTYNYKGIPYNKIQLLTVEDVLIDKKGFHTPTLIGVREIRRGKLTSPYYIYSPKNVQLRLKI